MNKEWMRYYRYLEELRKSGIINMFGAGPYLENQFGLDKHLAREILTNWMKYYSEILVELNKEVTE